MERKRVGEFEELTLLAVRALGEPAYAVPVQRFIEKRAGRAVSMGAVYAATDVILGAKVAVKLLNPEAASVDNAVEDFLAEAKLLNLPLVVHSHGFN